MPPRAGNRVAESTIRGSGRVVLVLYRNSAGAARPHIILLSMRASDTALGLLARFAGLIAASSALQDRVVLLVSANENLGRPRRCVEVIDREVAGHIRLIRLPRDLRRIRMLVDLHSVASCSLQ